MELELQKYECHNEEYLIYDCTRNRYVFGEREARVMCSQSTGVCVKKVLVGPIIKSSMQGDITMKIYNPDGTTATPRLQDVKVFLKYLQDAGYEQTPRSDTGIYCDSEDIKKICRMIYFENFLEKYCIQQSKTDDNIAQYKII